MAAEEAAGSRMEGNETMDSAKSGHGWKRRADQEFADVRDQNLRPSFSQIRHILPLSVRYSLHFLAKLMSCRKPPIDQVRMRNSLRLYGVPCGGLGAGTVGRGFRGEFCRFQMAPGDYSQKVVRADAFHLLVSDPADGSVLLRTVLASDRTSKKRGGGGRLSKWKYEVKDENIHYRGLYPRSWTTYDLPELGLSLTCRQTSPFLPGDYSDSSLPVAVFDWRADNSSGRDYDVRLALTFRDGWGEKTRSKCGTETIAAKGIRAKLIHQEFRGLRLTYGIGVAKSGEGDEGGCRLLPDFDPDSDGAELLAALADNVSDVGGRDVSSGRRRVGVGVSKRTAVQAKSSTSAGAFALTWDQPEIRFAGGARTWQRWYTRFFESTQEKTAAPALLRHAFDSRESWTAAIEAWQDPVLSDHGVPDWLKSAAFNELYYLADGGSQWLRVEEEFRKADDPRSAFGRFCYLESQEYRMFNTYDVHFYASHTLLDLFPGLELSLQADFVDYTAAEDPTRVKELYGGKMVKLNSANAVPHDLGDPEDEPYERVNAYRIHDVSQWKDLSLKFVVSTWRDVAVCCDGMAGTADERVTKCAEFLARRSLPVCSAVMERASAWDEDGDGLIENSGKPDQTYDTWVMTGPSSYCNSLWIAALRSHLSLLERAGQMASPKLTDALAKAAKSFTEILWVEEGGFFAFDSTEAGRDTVMSDQLCGLWYLDMIRLGTGKRKTEEGLLFDSDKVRRSLKTVHRCNVLGNRDGATGAANGFRRVRSLERERVKPLF